MPSSAMLNLLLPLTILAAAPPPASMLCVYGGELYATTTMEQEFADSAWVGRVRVLSARDSRSGDDPDRDGEPWTLYQVRVIETFKGSTRADLTVFTWRNSGGFYMDRPSEGPDIGGEYLLFLNPQDATHAPAEARGAMSVNYSCGQSRLWSEVTVGDRHALARLRRWGRPRRPFG